MFMIADRLHGSGGTVTGIDVSKKRLSTTRTLVCPVKLLCFLRLIINFYGEYLYFFADAQVQSDADTSVPK